jgi:hypothetical protein
LFEALESIFFVGSQTIHATTHSTRYKPAHKHGTRHRETRAQRDSQNTDALQKEKSLANNSAKI